MSELDIIGVSAAHGVKLSVGWEKDSNRADTGHWHVRTGQPDAGAARNIDHSGHADSAVAKQW